MNETLNIKRKFLSAIIRLAALATMLMAPVAIYMGFYLVVISQIILTIALFIADYYVKWKLNNFTMATLISFGLGFIATSIVTVIGDRDIFYWFLLFPPATMFAFGIKNGLKWNISTILIIVLLLINQVLHKGLPATSAIIIISSYTAIVFISYFLENARQTIENRLESISITDFLTNAKNRRGFDHALRQQIESSKRHGHVFCILSIDLDHFKKVNDLYGHDAGDQVLIAFTNLIKENLRLSDDLFRTGGEEFTIILPETNLSGADMFAKRLHKCINSFNFPYVKQITASMGLVQSNLDSDRESLLKRADKMLYLAKDHGRNRIETEAIHL
ncbi:MAG: GGDEF domain-containing protein [Spirochaetia bacterium]|nr:GGDEF domain-containing protein [Spirochaetia bacterium]